MLKFSILSLSAIDFNSVGLYLFYAPVYKYYFVCMYIILSACVLIGVNVFVLPYFLNFLTVFSLLFFFWLVCLLVFALLLFIIHVSYVSLANIKQTN